MIKIFVLDTNVLLHSAGSIESFQDNDVVIPMAVLEELDKFKKSQDELGRNARQVIRRLDALREFGSLAEGVSLANLHSQATGKLSIAAAGDALQDPRLMQFFIGENRFSPDNRILAVALDMSRSGREVIFISKDINLRLKADALGLKVMDYEREKVRYDDLYCGFKEFDVSPMLIEQLNKNSDVPSEEFKLLPNEFAVLKPNDGSQRGIALARNTAAGRLQLVPAKPDWRVWSIGARNKEQRMAFELLLEPEIVLVSLVGTAGTGKTLLALAAALESTLHENRYEKILVSRPIIPLGNDIGYLPGDKAEKLNNWMQPIFDNLDLLMSSGSPRRNARSASSGGSRVENLLNTNRLELEALTYIRGRSIPRQFVIVDEAQNLTPQEVKTIISRAGEGTKIVLTGDPEQIDNPYLDASSNGLSYLVERFKGNPLYGHVTLKRSERSPLAALAAKLL